MQQAAVGGGDWYWLGLTANLDSYTVPLSPGAWAVPDYNPASRKLLNKPVRVSDMFIAARTF